MIKRLLLLAAFLLLPTLSFAQTSTVTGHILYPSGGASANGKACFTLSNFKPNSPRVSGTGVIVQNKNFCVNASSVDGSFSTTLYRNDQITPGSTYWRVDFLWNGQQESSANYNITTATYNLDTATPIVTTPLPASGLVTSSYNCQVSSPLTTWTCVHAFNDKNVTVTVYNLNGAQIFPNSLTLTDANTVTLTWVTPQAGNAVIIHASAIAIAISQANAVLQSPSGSQTINSAQALTINAATAHTGNNTHTGSEIFSGKTSIALPTFPVSPWVDVTDPAFGAKCDGVTDDTTAIQNAINAAALFQLGNGSRTGGTVFIPPNATGSCVVSTLTLNNMINVTFQLGFDIGYSGANGGAGQATIKFTGNCVAAACLTMQSSVGIVFQGGQLLFSGATQGPFIDMSPCTPVAGPCLGNNTDNVQFHGTFISGPGTTIGPMISTSIASNIRFDQHAFFSGASIYIDGPCTVNVTGCNSQFSDSLTLDNVTFNPPGTASIQNSSINWGFSHVLAVQNSVGGLCKPFLQFVNGYNQIQALSITNSEFGVGAAICNNAYSMIQIPNVTGNLGGLTFTSNLAINAPTSTQGTLLTVGNNENFTSHTNMVANWVVVYALGTGTSVQIGPHILATNTTYVAGTPASGIIFDSSGNVSMYPGPQMLTATNTLPATVKNDGSGGINLNTNAINGAVNIANSTGTVVIGSATGCVYFNGGAGNRTLCPPASGVGVNSAMFISNQGTACTNGELALSAGWQSTGAATVTAVQGLGQTCSWTITTGTTTAANPTVTDTLTNTLPSATIVCTLTVNGGTHTPVVGAGTSDSFRQTTLSATAPVFTYNETPTAGGTTYFVTRQCGP